MRILSLDLGVKSLGSCVSDELNIIAIPIENYLFERGNFEIAKNRVLELVEKYNVTKILLGHPLRTDGKKSEATYMSEEFYILLKKSLENVEVSLFDERFSTQRGVELLEKKYKDPEKIREMKDMAAAYVMLIDYLSHNNI